MRALAALVLVLMACASEGPPRTFDNNEMELSVGNFAKMSCSCVFVMEMPDEYCRAWVKATPDIGSFSIDHQRKQIDASAFTVWTATARFVDERHGCVLE